MDQRRQASRDRVLGTLSAAAAATGVGIRVAIAVPSFATAAGPARLAVAALTPGQDAMDAASEAHAPSRPQDVAGRSHESSRSHKHSADGSSLDGRLVRRLMGFLGDPPLEF